MHTLKYRLHTLIKRVEYQIDNVLVYAVYAKTKLFLSEPLQDLLLARVMMAQVPRITLRKGQAQKLSFGAWPQREVFGGEREKDREKFFISGKKS